jgi:hypothetical protein
MTTRRLLKFLLKIEFSPHLRRRNPPRRRHPSFVANLALKKKYVVHAAVSKKTSSQASGHGFTRALSQCSG